MNILKKVTGFGGVLLLSILMLNACTDSGENVNPDFDRSEMLTNYADNLIIPAYSKLSSSSTALTSALATFTSEPNSMNLSKAQNTWFEAYSSWQNANSYNFGPAGAEGLRKSLLEEIGTFPVNVSKIESASASGNYSLTDANRDARGFLTIEYLLFSDTEDAVIAQFTDAKRKKFLNDLGKDIQSRVESVTSEWTSSYRDTFVSNNGTSAGSSISYLFNEFVRSYETIKNYKLGLPLGLLAGQSATAPNLVEALYSGKSVALFKTHILSSEIIWQGGNGLGFDDYLKTVTGGPALLEATQQQLMNIDTAMDKVADDPVFSTQVDSNPEPGTALQIELQKNTRYFKSDLSSLLGIAITFSSGDGD